MTYTREQLEKMSDFEVNMALACELGKLYPVPDGCDEFQLGDKVAYYDKMRCINVCNEDYCDDWSAIMPLAVEHGVTYGRVFCPAGSGPAYYAKQIDGDIQTDYEQTPQRAIACCLLMMEIEK